MCLYPRLIRNKKYLPNRKNGYNPPTIKDLRTGFVAVGCGKCIECRRQKAHAWQTRLHQELKKNVKAYFVTLTFSEDSIKKLCNELRCTEGNAIASLAVRRFLERWRKKYKKSLRHWLITEMGHQGTERIHIHGIVFTNEIFDNSILENYWSYGMTYTGTYCNERTINYVVKYVTKLDADHKGFEGQIMTSAGIGNNWVNSEEFNARKYIQGNTIEYITLPNGCKMNLPIYYRNKIYNEEEREKLWIEKMNEQKIYVCGIECDISTKEGINRYLELLKNKQEENTAMGFGTSADEWKKKEYNATLKCINSKTHEKCKKKHNTN